MNGLPMYSGKAFAPLAQKYRKESRRQSFALVGSLFIGVPLLNQFLHFNVAILTWFVGATFLMIWLHPKMPDCPKCSKPIDDLYGPYCPDCGGRLRRGAGREAPAPVCEGCDKTLRRGTRSRNFKYRACTHCGAQLDEQGL